MRLILSFLSFCDFSDFFNISYVVNNKIQSNKTFQEKHKKNGHHIFSYILMCPKILSIYHFFFLLAVLSLRSFIHLERFGQYWIKG